MKKLVTIAIVCIAFSLSAFAQNNTVSAGTSQFKAGIGFGSIHTFPPIHISYEVPVYSISEKSYIGAGGFVGIEGYYSLLYWGVGANALFHYYFTPSFDVYSGPAIRYAGVTSTETDFHYSGLHMSWIVGMQYYFNDHFGLFLQEGGYSTASIGVAYRF